MNLLNLLGATLLTVSPILNEPKNVTRPDNVIMEKVEYLDYNIVASTYIYEDGDFHNFYLNLNDGKALDVSFKILSDYTGGVYGRDLYLEFGAGEFNYLFETTDLDVLSEYGELSLYEYVIYFELDNSYSTLYANLEHEVYEDLEVTVNEDVLSVIVSSEFSNYYRNEDFSYIYNLGSNNLFTYYMSKYFFLKESAPITDNIFDVVGGTVEEYLNVVVDLFNEVVELFYVNNKLTILGVLLVFTFGIGIVKFGFNLIKSLLRL